MPYIINTSRGEMIDENSLLFALKNRLIKGAAIDVLTDEQNLDLRKNKLVNYSKKIRISSLLLISLDLLMSLKQKQ